MSAYKNRHQHNLPAGCHDADTASQLLGISKRALLKRMRELGWLKIGGGPNNHNLPRREYTARGWLAIQDRGYALKGKPEIARMYRVMLITQKGFENLKNALENSAKTEPKPTAETTDQQRKTTNYERLNTFKELREMTDQQRKAANRERLKALEALREMGLTIP